MTETIAGVIANSDVLVRAIGHWPSFHDAKVKSVVRKDASVRVTLHAFERGELRSDGYYASVNHHLVTIRGAAGT